MEVKVPKIVKPLELKEYANEFGEAHLEVWVNPPRTLVTGLWQTIQKAQAVFKKEEGNKETESTKPRFFQNLIKKAFKGNSQKMETLLNEQLKILSELMSQGEPETRLSAAELRKMLEDTYDTDPAFYAWLRNKTLTMIEEHRTLSKKA